MTRLHWTADGGVEFIIEEDDGAERRVKFVPDENGNIEIQGVGPNGTKSGKIDPSGNGDNPLGK